MKNLNAKIWIPVLLFSLPSWSLGFSQSSGDYAITQCGGVGTRSSMNYCNYDEVKISPLTKGVVAFEFFSKGTSALKFNIQDNPDQNNSILSRDNGMFSELSLIPTAEGPVLKLSSISFGNIYSYELHLESM